MVQITNGLIKQLSNDKCLSTWNTWKVQKQGCDTC